MYKNSKIIKMILIILSILIFTSSCTNRNENSAPKNVIGTVTGTASSDSPDISAKHCIVIENDSERVLYEKSAYNTAAMASTTKIMTALVVIEQCELSETVTVSSYAASIGGSTIDLKTGEELSVEDLLYGLMLESGNDAATALAEHTADSVDEFCKLMNSRAKELGAMNTNFTSPHGLDNENHYTTAYDLAIITKEALKNDTFCEIVNTKTISTANRFFANTNPLLGVVDGIDGVKTGFTNNAGKCIVLTAERGGMRIITVILGCPDSKNRIIDGKKITEYIFSKYKIYNLTPEHFLMGTAYIKKSKTAPSEAELASQINFPLTEDEYKNLSFRVFVAGKEYKFNNGYDFNVELKNNTYAGDAIGTFSVYSGNTLITEVPIILKSDVIKKDFYDFLKDVTDSWIWLLSSKTKS